MKKCKNLISLAIAVIMVLSLMTAAFADSSVILSGSLGENVTWTLTGDGVLTVSGTGPIKDEVEILFDDGEGNVEMRILNSIGMSVDEYFSDNYGDLRGSEAEQAHLNLVKEIVVEEGITEIPDGEFGTVFPRKVTLPSTLEKIGYNAFYALFAEEITVSSVKVDSLNISVAAYKNGAEPYGSLDEAIEGYLDGIDKVDETYTLQMPLDVLAFAYYHDNLDEDEINGTIDYYNSQYDMEAETPEDFIPKMIELVNEHFGTEYETIDQIIKLITDGEDTYAVPNDELLAMREAEWDSINDDSRLMSTSLGIDWDEVTAYGFLTITAPKGGNIEKDCATTGVNFSALEGAQVPNENACKFCGEDHTANVWQKIVGFFHSVLYFFAHLFGIM